MENVIEIRTHSKEWIAGYYTAIKNISLCAEEIRGKLSDKLLSDKGISVYAIPGGDKYPTKEMDMNVAIVVPDPF